MRAGGYNLGGEQSGHLVFLDHASTGDGMVAALQVLALMLRTGKPLSRARGARDAARAAGARERDACRRAGRSRRCAASRTLTAKIAKALGDDGRVLVRWSGTEPKLRIMLEGPHEERIRAWAKELAEAARIDINGE